MERESSTARKVTPTSKAKGMQRAHCSPATPNFNLVSQPRVIKTAKGDGIGGKGGKKTFHKCLDLQSA